MSAKIYPRKEYLSEIPMSEELVYDYLSMLDDSYTVFYSVHWVKKGYKRKSTWKENDFLILNRNLGALVLEIKGGDISYHDGAFHQINTLTREDVTLSSDKKKDPLSQAIDGVYHYRQLLSEYSPDLESRFPIEAAVWFSSSEINDKISNFPLAYREISGAVLGNEAFDRKNAIADIFYFYWSKNKVSISDEEYKSIVDLFAEDFDLITAPSIRKKELDHAFIRLTNEQMGLLDYISEQKSATIQGVAGTGKTVVAKEAARRFGNDGRKVLFLCFNRFLYSYLQHTFPFKNVTYLNIHSFINRYSDLNQDLSKPSDRSDALQRIDWDLLDYDDVIIDEAQDFDNNEILYFKDYCELKDGHYFVFYDKNQLLTTKSVPEWITKSECRLILTKNCRNTYEIALTSYNVIDVELNQKITLVRGDKTSICFASSDPLIKLNLMIKKLTSSEYGYDYSDIVILTLKTESESILNGINRLSGVPISREQNDSSVFFTTAIKFKGLESRALIITDIDKNAFINEEKKRVFYVACSRATQKLILFIDGNDGDIKDIADAIGGSKKFTPQGKIIMKTQSQLMSL